MHTQTITRQYLEQRRAELVEQHRNAQAQARQSEATALQLGGSIVQIDELLAILPPAPPPSTPPAL